MPPEQYQQSQEKQKPQHGEPPDDRLKQGPVTDRGCTDIFCLIIFIGCCGFMIYIFSIGFSRGEPLRLTYPYDPDDRACGYDTEVKNAPYIYLVAPYNNFFNRSLCVSECPYWLKNQSEPIATKCVTNSVVNNCTRRLAIQPDKELEYKDVMDINLDDVSIPKIMNYSLFIYNSTPLFDRICIPDVSTYADKIEVGSVLDMQTFQEWVSDIQTCWPIIALSAGLAVVIGMIYMILMRYCSGVLTWLAILLYFAAMILLIIFVKDESKVYQDKADFNKANGVSDDNNSDQDTAQALQILYYVLIALVVLSFVALICYFSRIRLAIAIIKSSSLFLLKTPLTLLVPPFFAFWTIAFWIIWIVAFIYVYSVGEIKGSQDSPFATITWDKDTRNMLYYQVFMALWCNALLQAICGFILASTCCLWYYAQGPGQAFFQFPILVSTKRAIFNHLGSLIFGALLLAIVQFIRLWLEYIHYQVSKVQQDPPQPMKCLLNCCRCYAAYFERFISFLNKNAYIQIALTGKGFLSAAKDGFYLVFSNPSKFAIVNGIGGLFTKIGQLFIAVVTTYICYLIITHTDYKDKIFSPFLPIFFFFFVSYFVGALFMMVYGMSMDTILQCSIVDEEVSKREGKAPQFCPEPLREFYASMEQK